MSERTFRLHSERIARLMRKSIRHIEELDTEFRRRYSQIERDLEEVEALIAATPERMEATELALKKSVKAEIRSLQQENEKLRKLLAKMPAEEAISEAEIESVKRASTLAIYDSIIFAISNWSNEGDTAPDFELACQATLFPTVYERVMKGNEDYYLEEVPVAADIVVERGREYVKHFRNVLQSSLVDPEAWEEHANSIQQWWVRDALPLIYGARADEWDDDVGLSLDEALEWRDQPASRALHFPLIFDGMELVEKHRDQIRESTGLPDFNKRTLQTRLQP